MSVGSGIWDEALESRCDHLDEVRRVRPSADGCEDCLKTGGSWVHLRICLICGHVGCCDSSVGQHARAHFQDTGHCLIASIEPGEQWAWCYIEEVGLPGEWPRFWLEAKG